MAADPAATRHVGNNEPDVDNNQPASILSQQEIVIK
jgi:hypothetical protein